MVRRFIALLALMGASGCGADANAPDASALDGAAPVDAAADAAAGPVRVLLSEIMYHPVDENAPEDNHEFVEIYNAGDAAVNLAGWRLAGEVSFTFPAGTTIAPHGYRVVAKNRSALAAIARYNLAGFDLLGDYDGQLDNDGGKLALLDAAGAVVDELKYSKKFPWPIGANALGAGDRWLGRLPTPIVKAEHRYMGRSLERASFDVQASEVSNWIASPLDGATPGRANSKPGALTTIVTELSVKPSGGGPLVRAADTVTIRVAFSALGVLRSPRLQYFVDDVQRDDEPLADVPITLAAGAYEASLPAHPAGSIVRYRIQADVGNGVETISPRASDPFTFWAYFVTPEITTAAPTYHLFIRQSDWTQLWDNINFDKWDKRVVAAPGATEKCLIRESWDATVPAVLVYDGVVYDTFVRYEGSHAQRTNGIPMDATRTTINPLPLRPAPGVYSWRLDFPSYAGFDPLGPGLPRRDSVVLNKLLLACPGLQDAIGERLYGDPRLDLPVQRTRFVRVHVNGGYYHYMMDIEHVDADLMKRYVAPGDKMGDLFKCDGNAGPDWEGPWGMADESVMQINPKCPMYSVDDRYDFTYQRFTNTWETSHIVRELVEAINPIRDAAVASGDYTALRAYLKETFDYESMLNYLALRNWMQVWDDAHHNHFLYRRASDHKWTLIVQDKDAELGEAFGWDATRGFYEGEQGDPDNRKDTSDQWEGVKDPFIKAFRQELIDRLVSLDQTVLSPANFQSKVDEAAATFSVTDYKASPASASACDFDSELNHIRTWGNCRHKAVLALKAGTRATCP